MKITNSSQAPAATTGATRAGASGRSASPKGSSAAAVSTSASALVAPVEAQLSSSDFSTAKVQEVSSAIASGNYQVNAGAVADKLLASAAALAGGSGSKG
jgi:negative regulator of flagellin synthesis FlgM